MWRKLIHQLRFFVSHFSETVKIPTYTVDYPNVVKTLPAAARAGLKNNFPECTGCGKCQDVCPVHAIEIKGYEYSKSMRRPTTSQGIPFEREVENFKVDYGLCIFCGICVNECPTGSLTFSKSFVKPEMHEQKITHDLVHIPRSMRPGVSREN